LKKRAFISQLLHDVGSHTYLYFKEEYCKLLF